MSFFEDLLPRGLIDLFASGGGRGHGTGRGGRMDAPAHGTPASAVDAGVPDGPSPSARATADLYKGMYDTPSLPSQFEPWRGVPWKTPDQVGEEYEEEQRLRQLVKGSAGKPLPMGPTIPPPHARDTIGPISAEAIMESEREAIWRATPEFNNGIPVDKRLKAKTQLEKINESGQAVNAPWKWLTQFDGLAPGTGDALPNNQIGPLGRPPTTVDGPQPWLPPHPIRR